MRIHFFDDKNQQEQHLITRIAHQSEEGDNHHPDACLPACVQCFYYIIVVYRHSLNFYLLHLFDLDNDEK